MVLIGTRCDSPSRSREVTYKNGEELAYLFGSPFFEVSAVTGEGVQDVRSLRLCCYSLSAVCVLWLWSVPSLGGRSLCVWLDGWLVGCSVCVCVCV